MNSNDLMLYELLGNKTLSFGCIAHIKKAPKFNARITSKATDFKGSWITEGGYQWNEKEFDVIGHEPTIADLHRWLITNGYGFSLHGFEGYIIYLPWKDGIGDNLDIQYDSSKSLLEQSEDTKQAIISLIESHA